jgi:hypothetical protein
MAKPIIVHRYFVAFDRMSDRLIFTFGESDWEVRGQQGATRVIRHDRRLLSYSLEKLSNSSMLNNPLDAFSKDLQMKTQFTFAIVFSLLTCVGCQPNPESSSSIETSPSQPSISIVNQIVEASCGECQFDMEGDGCDLAVRIDGQDYYVDGTSIDDHGDAHGEAGFCNCIRKANVTGEVKDGRFLATSFELLPRDE